MAETHNTVVATYAKHEGAEAAIRKVGEAGLDLGRFTIVGRASHVEERVTGLRQTGDRVGFWAECGTLWGGVSGLPIGGLMVDLPEVGPVLVVGHMAMAVAVAITGGMDGAVLGVLGAALAGIGVPHPSILECREALAGEARLGRKVRAAPVRHHVLARTAAGPGDTIGEGERHEGADLRGRLFGDAPLRPCERRGRAPSVGLQSFKTTRC